jgi:hypothetical protein
MRRRGDSAPRAVVFPQVWKDYPASKEARSRGAKEIDISAKRHTYLVSRLEIRHPRMLQYNPASSRLIILPVVKRSG